MIVDKVQNVNLHSPLSDSIAKALEILKDNPAEKADGRYDVDGDNLFYLVQRYQTGPIEQGKLEAHKKYIDIQFVAEGIEIIGYEPIGNLETDVPYSEEKDCVFYKPGEDFTPVTLTAGMFCILYPDDAHMPAREVNVPCDVTKVVIKVKING